MLRIKKHGQSTIEYAILIIIILGAFLAIGQYFKRAVQGRWKSAVDDLGDQYDPRYTNSSINQTLQSNIITTIVTLNATDGFYTFRSDQTNAVEGKSGFMAVGSY